MYTTHDNIYIKIEHDNRAFIPLYYTICVVLLSICYLKSEHNMLESRALQNVNITHDMYNILIQYQSFNTLNTHK